MVGRVDEELVEITTSFQKLRKDLKDLGADAPDILFKGLKTAEDRVKNVFSRKNEEIISLVNNPNQCSSSIASFRLLCLVDKPESPN